MVVRQIAISQEIPQCKKLPWTSSFSRFLLSRLPVTLFNVHRRMLGKLCVSTPSMFPVCEQEGDEVLLIAPSRPETLRTGAAALLGRRCVVFNTGLLATRLNHTMVLEQEITAEVLRYCFLL